jgi:hypothetical protein
LPFTRFIQQVQQRHANLVVLDARRSGYPESAFADETHLNRRGASELSAALAGSLAARFSDPSAGPAWAAFPAFQNCPVDLGLEDLEQSTRIVHYAGSGRWR